MRALTHRRHNGKIIFNLRRLGFSPLYSRRRYVDCLSAAVGAPLLCCSSLLSFISFQQKKEENYLKIPLWDILLAVLGFISIFYIFTFMKTLSGASVSRRRRTLLWV